MTQSTGKPGILALVGSMGRSEARTEERATALRESFDGWLNSVAPTLLQSAIMDKPNVTKRLRRSLTSTDVIRVNRATVRESTSHRHWPPDVVISFLGADVIKRNNKR